MEKGLSYFQEVKDGFIENNWFLVQEGPYEITFKEDEDEEELYVLQFLKRETQDFLAQETEVENGIVTHFSSAELSDREVEVVWNFMLRGTKYMMSAYFDAMLRNQTVTTYLVSPWNKIPVLQTLGTAEKEDLTRMYERFKQMIKELPKYRLYFTTEDVLFEESQVRKWL